MSEYQYYEFLAIDRPLTSDEMAALRGLSTRAAITPVSFTNEYNWGDFKGDPDKLMERYFDAHVYVANWMTAIFMVRLPIEALTRETAKAMATPYLLDVKLTKTHWIITRSLEESENYDRFGMEDGRGWMARLIRIEKQKRDRKQREIKRREKRKAYLKNLSSDFSKAWASVKEPVERGSGRGYDEACRILVDIAEAYDLFATKNKFQQELKKFTAGYLRRKALIQRLVKAGIWKGR
jgi:hypothetical protein